MSDLLSGDPERIREANRRLYRVAVAGGHVRPEAAHNRAADLVLATATTSKD